MPPLLPRPSRRSIRTTLCALSLALGALTWPASANPVAASRSYDEALKSFGKADHAAAAIHLKNALQADNKMLAAHLLLGKVLSAMGEYKAAEASFEEALKLGVSRAEVAPLLGPVYLQLGEPRKVLELVTAQESQPVARAQSLTLRGAALAMSGSLTQAAEHFADARRLDPQSAAPYLAEAPILLRSGEVEKARLSALKATELAPGNSFAWFQLASIQHARGDLNGALASLDKALAIAPKHVDSLVSRAMVLVALGRRAEAEKLLTFLKTERVKEPRASWVRGMLERADGQAERAKGEFADAVGMIDAMGPALRNGSDPLLMAGALSHYHLGNTEKAREYLSALLGRNSKHLAAQLLMASILVDAEDFSRAMPLLEGLNRSTPDNPEVLHLLGKVYMGRGQLTLAVELLEKATRASGGNAALRDLSLTQLALGRAQQGQSNLEKAYARNPKDLAAGMELAVHYARTGQGAKAVQVAESVLKTAPADPSLLNFVGNIKGRIGDRKGQRAAYQAALDKSPAFRPVILNMGWLDMDEGRFDAARQRLEAYLKGEARDHEAVMQLGVIEQRARRSEVALQHFQRADSMQAKDPRPGLAVIETLLSLRQADQALAAAKGLTARFPDRLDVQLLAARAYAAAGNPALMRATLSQASKLAGYDVDALNEVARNQLRAGILDGASYTVGKALQTRPDDVGALLLQVEVAAARRAAPAEIDKAMAPLLAKHPSHPGTQTTVGHIAMSRGQFAKAIASYRSVFERAPSTQNALLLAQALLAAKDADKALAHLQAWVAKNPADGVARRALADTFAASGKVQQAKASYGELLKADPGNEELMAAYAQVLRRLDDPAAVAMAEKAYKLAPRNLTLADGYGWMLVQTGQAEAGIRVLREARLRDPNHPAVRWHLAAALAKVGRQGEAKDELQAALAAGLAVPQDVDAARLRADLGL